MGKEGTPEDIFFEELYLKLTRLEDSKEFIQTSIIPRMDLRRGRGAPMSRKDINQKLGGYDLGKKPEGAEFLEEMARAEVGVTPQLALEIADLTYYSLQPNAEERHLKEVDVFLEGLLGIDMSYAYMFCIVKYETRLQFGDLPDYKIREKEIMTEFLSKVPDLHLLWPDITRS